MREVCESASVAPEEVGYVEMHGTGTPLGDPIEVNGLKKALGDGFDDGKPCWLGSIKSNMGHLTAAAGAAAPVADLVAPVFELDGDTPLHTALTRMRETANHLALVHTGQGAAVATMADVLAYLFPRTTAGGQGSQGAPVPGGR